MAVRCNTGVVGSSPTISQRLYYIITTLGINVELFSGKGQSVVNNSNIRRNDAGPWSSENDPIDSSPNTESNDEVENTE